MGHNQSRHHSSLQCSLVLRWSQLPLTQRRRDDPTAEEGCPNPAEGLPADKPNAQLQQAFCEMFGKKTSAQAKGHGRNESMRVC